MPFTVKLPEGDAADPDFVPPIDDDKPFWEQIQDEHIPFTVSYFYDDHPERNVDIEVQECEQEDGRILRGGYILYHEDDPDEDAFQCDSFEQMQECIKLLCRSSNARRTFESFMERHRRVCDVYEAIRAEERKAELHDDSLAIHFRTERPTEYFNTKEERDEALRAMGRGRAVAH